MQPERQPAGVEYFGAAAGSEVNVPKRRAFPAFNWAYVLALLLALATLGCGVYQQIRFNEGWAMVGTGALGVIAVLAAWPVTMCLYSGRCSSRNEAEQVVQPLLERLDQLSILINQMGE